MLEGLVLDLHFKVNHQKTNCQEEMWILKKKILAKEDDYWYIEASNTLIFLIKVIFGKIKVFLGAIFTRIEANISMVPISITHNLMAYSLVKLLHQ